MITVGVCTWNRSAILRQSLETYRRLILPPGLEWELIVVNNACTDETDTVIGEFADLPIRLLHEPRSGKSIAADLATREARGDLLLLTDDDVSLSPDLLVQYAEAAARRPDADFFGGPVLPWWEAPPPDWLREGLGEAALPYALLDLGATGRFLQPHERFNGPNFAIRREVAQRFSRNQLLGPRPKGRLVGEESALQASLMDAGHRGLYLPNASVQHHVPAVTMTKEYIARRYRLHGRTLMAGRPAGARRLLICLRSLSSVLLESGPRYLLSRALRRPSVRWLRPYRRLHTHLGKISALFRTTGATPPVRAAPAAGA